MPVRRISLLFVVALTLVPGGRTNIASPRATLWAPTYYIAAKATYDGDPNEMRISGASNLPPGSRLYANVYRYIGEGGDAISESAYAVVDNRGFFEAILHPTKGNRFQHNQACDIAFMVHGQPPSVLEIVGRRGQRLGFPQNPQADVASGRFYLDDLIHVP